MRYYFEALKKYAVFSGRARRKEYWFFILFNCLIYVALLLLEKAFGYHSHVFASIYNLGVSIPNLAVGVRRIHDSGKSGWFIFLPFYNLFLWCIEGTTGDNKYGPSPKNDAK